MISIDNPIATAMIAVPSKAEYLPGIRDLVEKAASNAGFSMQEVQRLATAAFEAATNALIHGSPLGIANTITVNVIACKDRVVVEVKDQGPGFDLSVKSHEMPDMCSPRGRGIPLMMALVDSVETVSDNGTRVILTKYLGK
jgi:serine/threonine-protein kinase RsbW